MPIRSGRGVPIRCADCKKRIKIGEKYEPVLRYAREGEQPSVHGGRVQEYVHAEELEDYRASLYGEKRIEDHD